MGRGKNQSEGKSSYYKRNSRKEGKTTKSVSESDHGRLKSLFVRGMNLFEKMYAECLEQQVKKIISKARLPNTGCIKNRTNLKSLSMSSRLNSNLKNLDTSIKLKGALRIYRFKRFKMGRAQNLDA